MRTHPPLPSVLTDSLRFEGLWPEIKDERTGRADVPRADEDEARPVAVGLLPSSLPWRPRLQEHLRAAGAPLAARFLRDRHDTAGFRFDVVVVDDVDLLLSTGWIARLGAQGTGIISMYDPEEQPGGDGRFVVGPGVDVALPAGIGGAALVAAIIALAGRISPEGSSRAQLWSEELERCRVATAELVEVELDAGDAAALGVDAGLGLDARRGEHSPRRREP
ncbi:MAG: hypothetical protein JWL73_1208 [Actinomycetia bacterium]|nr:hypothetical protein [Actinomycetes bacterium]